MNKKWILVGAMLVSISAFAQEQQTNEIEEVTVASKTPQTLDKTGKNVKLLTAQDLEKYSGQNLTEVINQIAGIQIKDVTGNDYNVSDLRLLALENVERIEVLNGAASVLYGSNATVSVINITTKKNTQKGIEGRIGLRGGSYSTFGQDVAVGGKIKHFNYQVSGFNEKSQGFSSAEGPDTFDKDGWEKQNIAANVGLSYDRFNVNLNTSYQHHLFLFDSGAFTDGNLRSDDRQFYVGGNAQFNYNNRKGNLYLNLRHSQTDRLVQDKVNGAYADQYNYLGKNLFAELYNNYKFNETFDLTAGVQYEKQAMKFLNLPYGGTEMEEILSFDDAYIQMFDVFAKAHYQYQGLHVDGGARLTNHSKFNNHLVYSINPYYIHHFEKTYFKGGISYATAFIAPTLYQNFGAKPWVLGNFNLKPETNRSWEMDLTYAEKNNLWKITANLFLRDEKDVFTYVVNPDYTGIFYNVDENSVKGFELGFDYQIISKVRTGANYSFVEKEKEATMLRQPKHKVNAYIEYTPCASTRLFLTHQFVGKRTDAYYDSNDYATKNVEVKGYHLFNLNIHQKISSQFSAFANVGNLFNISYTDVVGYKTKNRNYTVGINYQF